MGEATAEIQALVIAALRHHQAGQLDQAIAGYRQVLAHDPAHAGVYTNLGTALCEQGLFTEAEACYRTALKLSPRDAEAHNNLGTALYEQGKLADAVAEYRQALGVKPGHAEAFNNLGTALAAMGNLDEAQNCYRRALALKPGYLAARVHLGTVLWEQGKLEDAARAYARALESEPNYTDALDRLAAVKMLSGDAGGALDLVWRSLRVAETENSKRLFVDIARKIRWTACDARIRATMVRAMAEPWARPGDLAKAAADLIKLTPGVGDAVNRAAAAWPNSLHAAELFAAASPAALSQDELLCGLLTSAQNMDIGLERFLTLARHALLDGARIGQGDEFGLVFFGALARQCFINEYVFALSQGEAAEADALRAELEKALEAGTPVSALRVAAVAAYVPLYTLAGAERLLDTSWPAPVAAIVKQQLTERREIERLIAAMPRITPVEDDVSRRVQGHYQENPYPRWVRTALARNPVTIAQYLNRKFPLSPFRRDIGEGAKVLSAGCGTCIAAIEFATAIKGVDMQAVDLSLSSLAYAQARAAELGVDHIRFAQGDILRLGALDARFDIIESSGVLHHMADAFMGWRALLPMLKPGGFMLVGLYSETGRRDIVRARELIAERGYGDTPDEIRRCRQDLLARDAGESLGLAVSSSDFFGISTCRDLLLHSQEARLSLPEIAAFLKENNLTFLGFEIEDDALGAYRRRFPGDPAGIDLAQWAAFEADNPETFSNMYMLWVQKAAS